MRLFTRYIWSEVISHALLGGALFTFILFMKYIGQLLEMAARNSASMGSVLKIFLFMLPNTLSLTIPMAVLVGVLLGLAAWLPIAKSPPCARSVSGSGSLCAWFRSIAIFGWGISLFNSLYLAPKATAALLRIEDSLKQRTGVLPGRTARFL